MRSRYQEERGDTLVEVVFALVIIGLVVAALFSSFTTASNAANGNKNLVTADAVLRNTAEATKAAVRTDCLTSTTFVPTTSSVPGFPASESTNLCPSDPTQTRQVDITVTLPDTTTHQLSVIVRTP